MNSPRSLFIVSLPRSLSTVVHDFCAAALGLRSPVWTTAGEILNGERLAYFPDVEGFEARKFTTPEQSFAFRQLSELLDDVVRPRGRVYKDVVQPFVVSGWLARRRLPVLRIRRPLAEVARAMTAHGWLYPHHAAPGEGPTTRGLIRGLIRAERALDALSAEVLNFEELVESEEPLRAALRRLYPEAELKPAGYIDDHFRRRARAVAARREEPGWPALQREVAELLELETGRA
ncbi:MAG: hypothetical protein JOZ96_07705 [Acidobacteria bacterium]|nr:hypothetical protein [Acidobacteriota bacterium]